ncbi:hypothetical protein HWV62_474 [Athelia sp. TMB]|nr:hypothetical protein HWV62_474 [Athelia sp. TMB]
MASGEEALIQATPKKVYGALKKLFVVGVAACKTASACYTEDGEVYTWGTNSGQLGYDKSAQPVQVLPRKVTKVAVPVISISITDSVMACLLSSQDVVCIMNDRQFKISFPVHSFPSEMHVYHPPQAIRNTNIAKITSCDETFAALSSNGEVFTFTVPSLSETHTHDSRPISIKPQRVWALRKQFSGVRDVALGADGSLIVATQSGHVFVRSRNPKTSQAGAKTFKFQRIPYLQRVVAVCANSTGAFGALRVDYEVEKPAVEPESAGLGMQNVQSFLRLEERGRETDIILDSPVPTALQDAEDDDVTDVPIQKDISELQAFLRILSLENRALKEQQLQDDAIHQVHGADIVVQSSSGSKFPAHRVWLAARCPILRDVLEGKKVVQDGRLKISMRIPSISESKSHSPMGSLVIDGCSSLSCLILLAYFYTDELTSIWDPRITASLKHLRTIEVKPAQVKLELQAFAKVLELPKLAEAVQAPGKRRPMPSIHADLERLSTDTQKHGMTQIMGKGLISNALCPDVIIQLRDSEFLCHSVVLRARSSLFAAFFDDLDWTDHRRDKHGVIKINLKHWDWRVMQFPLRFLMIGNEQMEDRLNALVSTSDQAIEFLFEIIAAANELLLYRLVLICSNLVLEHLDITNACYMLSDATHYQSKALMHCSQDYLAANMETMLEGRMLDDLTPALVRQLTEFVRQRQAEKFAITRSAWMYDRATRRYGDWLSLQDIPVPIAPSVKLSFSKDPRLSPPGPSRRNRRSSGLTGSPVSPTMRPLAPIHPVHRVPSEGEMFLMDEADRHSPHVIAVDAPEDPTVSNHASTSQEVAAATGAVWTRRSSAQKVDMKTIMAEAANTQHSDVKSPPLYRSTVSERLPQRERRKLQTLNPTTVPDDLVLGPPRLSASPWKQNPTPSPVAFSDLALPPASSTPPSTLQTAPTQADRKKRPEAGSTSSLPSTPPRTQSLPGLGPVFSPSRQSPSVKASPSGSRRVSSSGAAWTLPPVEPVIESSTPLLTSGLSFVAIQQMQLDQGPTAVVDKRSILQIQEEEQALQAEADFMKWWHAEEERVKQEEAQIAAFTRGDVVQGKLPRKPKSAKKNPVAKQRASSSSEFNGGTSGSQPEGAQTGQATKPQKASKSTRTKLSTGKP